MMSCMVKPYQYIRESKACIINERNRTGKAQYHGGI
jgi:hypothetical protein